MSLKSTTDNLPLASATILLAIFGMSVGDAIIKAIGSNQTFGLWQLFAVRSAMILPVLAVIALFWGGAGVVIPKVFRWVALRGLLMAALWLAYYTALPHLPLSAAAASLYTLPLFITLFSAIFTDDKVTPIHGLAGLLGFAGAALVLRPGTDAFNAYALLPLTGAILFGLAMTLTRVKCQEEHPLALAFGLHAVFAGVGLIGLVVVTMLPGTPLPANLALGWTTLDAQGWGIMAILAISLFVASLGTAIAYQRAPIAVVGNFEFVYVGLAALWGFLFFSENLDLISAAGMIMIAAAGIWSARASATSKDGRNSAPEPAKP
ncbi:MAG: DMT family transporter [Pseudomonadota bacterium]